MFRVSAKPDQLQAKLDAVYESLLLAGIIEVTPATLESKDPHFVLTEYGREVMEVSRTQQRHPRLPA